MAEMVAASVNVEERGVYMFFKVNTTGCQERKGLVEIRYDCYLDPTEPAWKIAIADPT